MDEDFGFDLSVGFRSLKAGTTATREIRTYLKDWEPEKLRRTLIVGVTGFATTTGYHPIALAAGQDRVLGKPYEEDELKSVLLDWFRAKRHNEGAGNVTV